MFALMLGPARGDLAHAASKQTNNKTTKSAMSVGVYTYIHIYVGIYEYIGTYIHIQVLYI